MRNKTILSGEKTAEMYDCLLPGLVCVRVRKRDLEANIKAVAKAMKYVALPFLGGIEDGLPQSLSKTIIKELKIQEREETAAIAAEDNNKLVSLFYYLLPQHFSYEKQGYNYKVQEEKDEDTTGNLGRSDKEDYRYRGGGPSGGGVQTDVLPLCYLSRMARGGGGDTGFVGRATRMGATARAGSTERDCYARGCLLQPSHRRRLSIHRNYDRYQNHSTSEAL